MSALLVISLAAGLLCLIPSPRAAALTETSNVASSQHFQLIGPMIETGILDVPDVQLRLGGEMGERVRRNVQAYLLPLPMANPGIIEMFRLRDRTPRPELSICAGENIGKHLIGAVQALRMTDDPRLLASLRELVADFISTQDADGYLGPYRRDERFRYWDLWAHYHCILGLHAWYRHTGDQAALDAAMRAADMICDRFLDGDFRFVDVGSYEMNGSILHGLGALYRETGEERYFRMMRKVESGWPSHGDYLRLAEKGVDFYNTTPRWETLHELEGLFELYRITGEEAYKKALLHYWRSIRHADVHNTGGFSTQEEAIGNPYTSGSIETCCVVAWIEMSVDALRLTADSRIADAIELATWNAALGAQHPSGRWWTYDTPMDGKRLAGFIELSQPPHSHNNHTGPGKPELSCCATNAPRLLGMISEWAVQADEEGLYVNYYGEGEVATETPNGSRLRIEQQTRYPVDGRVRMTLRMEQSERFALRLRIPEWSRDTSVAVNGGSTEGATPGAYFVLERLWQDRDELTLDLDMRLRCLVGDEKVRHHASIYHGPLLLAYDQKYNGMEPDAVPTLDAEDLAYKIITPSGVLPSIVLFRFRAENGEDLVLCDFASAGAYGTHYRSWLPVAHAGGGRIHLRTPFSGSELPAGPIMFHWGDAGPDATYTLTVAVDRELTEVVFESADVEQNEISVEPEFAQIDGGRTYFWDVRIQAGDGPYPSENGPWSFTTGSDRSSQ